MTGALEELQEAGYIHGDIKPDNFVIQGMVDHTLNFTISRNRLQRMSLDVDSNAGNIKLIDFGQHSKYLDE